MASPPKFNVLNTAIMTVPSGYSFQEAQNDRPFRGRVVECAMGVHLYLNLPLLCLHNNTVILQQIKIFAKLTVASVN